MAAGQTRIEPQLVAQNDLVLVDRLTTDLSDLIGHRLKYGIGTIAQLIGMGNVRDQH